MIQENPFGEEVKNKLKQRIPTNYLLIKCKEMLAFGFKHENHKDVIPGAYTNTIMFLFIEISWGKL